jgi:peptide/nickel transport system substrate-binding protein
MEAHEDYWEDVPKVKTLVWRAVPEDATRVAELLSGNADVVHGIAPSDAGRIQESDVAGVVTSKSVRILYLDMDTREPPFDDVRVRNAVALAIDRQALINDIYGGRAYPVEGCWTEYTWGHNPNLEPYPYDPEKARELLAEAGYPDGLPTVFAYSSSVVQEKEVGLACADFLQQAGFDLDVKFMEWGTFVGERLAGELNLQLIAKGNTTGEPDQLLREFDMDRRAVFVQREDVHDMVKASMAEADPDKREQLVMEIEKKIYDEYLTISLLALQDIYGLNKRVHGFGPGPNELMWFLDVSVDQ